METEDAILQTETASKVIKYLMDCGLLDSAFLHTPYKLIVQYCDKHGFETPSKYTVETGPYATTLILLSRIIKSSRNAERSSELEFMSNPKTFTPVNPEKVSTTIKLSSFVRPGNTSFRLSTCERFGSCVSDAIHSNSIRVAEGSYDEDYNLDVKFGKIQVLDESSGGDIIELFGPLSITFTKA